MRPFRISAAALCSLPRLYPASVAMRSVQMQFHMHLWAAICEFRETNHGRMFIGDVALFSDARDRLAFERFWKRYSAWFEPGSWEHAFIPAIKRGVLGSSSSAFVADAWSIDDRLTNWNGDFSQDAVINAGRIGNNAWNVILPVWMWFPMRCSSPVYRIGGGFLFSNAKDAAKWRLFSEERAELIQLFPPEKATTPRS